jgi:hypothetical protein
MSEELDRMKREGLYTVLEAAAKGKNGALRRNTTWML